MKIAAFEPFYSGSHKQWLDGLVQHSSHEISIFTLPGRHWKWRMHGAAVTLANRFLESSLMPDLLLCTDMVNVAVLLSLIRHRIRDVPVILYMHENQLTYPWSGTDPDIPLKRDNHYAFINYTSACAADIVCFNSPYHADSFLESLEPFLKQFPDHQNIRSVAQIREKSHVVPLGLSLDRFSSKESQLVRGDSPVILWNHRWEYDKGPDEFFKLLYALEDMKTPFRLILCGEHGTRFPEVFDEARAKLKHRLLHFGYVENSDRYVQLLMSADILPVTSIQDFFGISIVEAMYCGVTPILPKRLTYEWLASHTNGAVLYHTFDELVTSAQQLLRNSSHVFDGCGLKVFDWKSMILTYDQLFDSLYKTN